MPWQKMGGLSSGATKKAIRRFKAEIVEKLRFQFTKTMLRECLQISCGSCISQNTKADEKFFAVKHKELTTKIETV